jgi:hypothetical protein
MQNGQNGNGQKTWLVGGRVYSNFVEAVEAQDRRVTDFLRRGGIGEEELARLPKRVIPEGTTADNYDPDSDWPIFGAIDETLGKKFRLFTGPQLGTGAQHNSAQHETRSLIPGVLAAGQLGGIFGAFKTLKTSLAADLLISLASGTPFLGRFPVSQPGRVLFLSGEAGLPATKSLAGRICAERGLSLDALENFVCSPDVPNLSDPFDVMAFTELVEREKPICVVIDPSFLALGAGGGRGGRGGAPGGARGRSAGKKSRSLFETGQLLRPLVELCESTGCAMLIVHHSPRSRHVGEPAMFDELAGSGVAEFSDQWLLVSRRRPFEVGTGQHGTGHGGTGHHELWLTTGSRAGEQGLWELDVDENTVEQGAGPTPAGGRRWKTAVRPASSPELQADQQFVATREDRNLRRRALAFERQCQRTLELLAAYPEGRTARFIRDTLGMSGDRINRLLGRLIENGVVVRTEDGIVDRRRPIVTYSRMQAFDLSAEAIRSRSDRPDQKVYDIGTGHFVHRGRGNAPAPGAAGAQHAGTRHAAAEGLSTELAISGGTAASLASALPATDQNPLADKPPVPPTVPELARDMGHSVGTGHFVDRTASAMDPAAGPGSVEEKSGRDTGSEAEPDRDGTRTGTADIGTGLVG